VKEIAHKYRLSLNEDDIPLLEKIKNNFTYASCVGPDRCRNEVVYLIAVARNAWVFKYIPEDYKNIKRICVMAAKQCGSTYTLFPKSMQNDVDVCWAAVHENPSMYSNLPNHLKHDQKFVLEAVRKDGGSLVNILDSFKINNAEVCLMAVRQNGYAVRHVPDSIKREREDICLAAVQQNGWALQDIPKDLKGYAELCLASYKEIGKFIFKHQKQTLITFLKKVLVTTTYRFPDNVIKNIFEHAFPMPSGTRLIF
jgi:hypothetical protein